MNIENLRIEIDKIRKQLNDLSKDERTLLRKREDALYLLRRLQTQCPHPSEEKAHNKVIGLDECGVCHLAFLNTTKL